MWKGYKIPPPPAEKDIADHERNKTQIGSYNLSHFGNPSIGV